MKVKPSLWMPLLSFVVAAMAIFKERTMSPKMPLLVAALLRGKVQRWGAAAVLALLGTAGILFALPDHEVRTVYYADDTYSTVVGMYSLTCWGVRSWGQETEFERTYERPCGRDR